MNLHYSSSSTAVNYNMATPQLITFLESLHPGEVDLCLRLFGLGLDDTTSTSRKRVELELFIRARGITTTTQLRSFIRQKKEDTTSTFSPIVLGTNFESILDDSCNVESKEGGERLHS